MARIAAKKAVSKSNPLQIGRKGRMGVREVAIREVIGAGKGARPEEPAPSIFEAFALAAVAELSGRSVHIDSIGQPRASKIRSSVALGMPGLFDATESCCNKGHHAGTTSPSVAGGSAVAYRFA